MILQARSPTNLRNSIRVLFYFTIFLFTPLLPTTIHYLARDSLHYWDVIHKKVSTVHVYCTVKARENTVSVKKRVRRASLHETERDEASHTVAYSVTLKPMPTSQLASFCEPHHVDYQ